MKALKRIQRFMLLLSAVLAIASGGLLAPANATTADPNWTELKREHQTILAPLQSEWNSLEPQRKRKWVGVANRYPSMTTDEQSRVRERMKDWAALTPDQRRVARDNFQVYRALPTDQKQAVQRKWREYQELPEEKRRELASRAAKPGSTPTPAALSR
jgi:Protein of unknown function (DUF3106)